MSLDFTPSDADFGSHAPLRPWTGRHVMPAALFEIRPRLLPHDVQPIFDEDRDCILGYYRRYGHRSYLYDLNANMVALWEDKTKCPRPEKRDPVLAVGGLWKEGMRGTTQVSLTATGITLAPKILSSLRDRFDDLAAPPLLYREAAMTRMQDAHRYAPTHILRLAMRHGERAEPPHGMPRAMRYIAAMLVRRQPFLLDVVTTNVNTTVVQFDYWRYATPPAFRRRGG